MLNGSDAWLDDAQIFFALKHFKHKYPAFDGLEDPLLLTETSNHKVKVTHSNTIFVLFTLNHWVVVTNMDLNCIRKKRFE
jgi:hypothetical protein